MTDIERTLAAPLAIARRGRHRNPRTDVNVHLQYEAKLRSEHLRSERQRLFAPPVQEAVATTQVPHMDELHAQLKHKSDPAAATTAAAHVSATSTPPVRINSCN